MRFTGLRQVAPAVLATVLLALLILLAWLQQRWLGQLSEGERGRAQAALEAAARQVAEGVDRQLTQLTLLYQDVAGGSSEELALALTRSAKRWLTLVEHPELLREVLVVRLRASGPVVERLDSATGVLAAAAWPAELAGLSQRFEVLGHRRGERQRRMAAGRRNLPVFVQPLFDTFRAGKSWREGATFLVFWIDQELLLSSLLPIFVERHLAATADGAYRVTVERRSDQRVLFTSGPAARRADVQVGMFALLPPDRFGVRRPRIAERGFDGHRPPREGKVGEPRHRHRAPLGLALALRDVPRWSLSVTHPAGSLEAAINRARRRNLAVSLAVLALLGLSALLLVASSRRAQHLAQQRLEFVAGVSHELLTPLAAMRSAGQNLADGVVRDGAKMRQYGRMIDSEGRRLSEMVAQVMEFAGIEAGGRDYQRSEVEPLAIIQAALEDCRPALEQRGVELEQRLPGQLPSLWVDGAALRRALQNLVTNAIKYAGDAGWVGVEAMVEDGRELRVEVADRGPGIPLAEQQSIFEPFVRGRQATAGATGGSGLGLSLVRHFAEGHGGGVELRSVPGEGSRFTLRLPLALPEASHVG